MAFRMSDFGIPNYDTNVNVLYQNAVAHGESILCGEEEYLHYRLGKTPLVAVLRFIFEADGETPKHVTAHTFLENDVRWCTGVTPDTTDSARVTRGDHVLNAELINPTATGDAYTPMLFADSVRFGADRAAVEASIFLQEGVLTPNPEGGVALMARVQRITPVAMSGLWLFSVVELALTDGSIALPVCRDIMEKQLASANIGALCAVRGSLSLLRDWQ